MAILTPGEGAHPARKHAGPQSPEPSSGKSNVASHIKNKAIADLLKRQKDYLVEHNLGDSHFAAAIASGIESVPPAIHEFLALTGRKIMTAASVVDSPMFANRGGETPRGYPPGQTWKNCPGAYDPESKTAVIGMSFVESYSNTIRATAEPEFVLREEVGHAFDDAKGSPSANNREFLKAYRHEAAAICDLAAEVLYYLLQPDGAGANETFAAIFAIIHGGVRPEQRYDEMVRAAFPRTFGHVAKIVAKFS